MLRPHLRGRQAEGNAGSVLASSLVRSRLPSRLCHTLATRCLHRHTSFIAHDLHLLLHVLLSVTQKLGALTLQVAVGQDGAVPQPPPGLTVEDGSEFTDSDDDDGWQRPRGAASDSDAEAEGGEVPPQAEGSAAAAPTASAPGPSQANPAPTQATPKVLPSS